jgi:hypothetical protein
VEWLRRHNHDHGRHHGEEEEEEEEEEVFASLSDDFRLFLCSVEGDVCASWNGIGVASAMTVLPPVVPLSSSFPARSMTASSSSSTSLSTLSRGAGRTSPRLHEHRGTTGWRDVRTLTRNPSGDSALGEDGAVEDAAGSSCASPAHRTGAYPAGHRLLIVRSEVYVELYEVREKPRSSASSTRRPSASDLYMFVAITHIQLLAPVVSLSPSFACGSAEDEVAVLAGLFGGDVATLILQVSASYLNSSDSKCLMRISNFVGYRATKSCCKEESMTASSRVAS